ncbi:hypothetical protein PHYBOEH_003204 [Phytophthora boehmeriae]|uniref:M96 mating-specific protein family n=1 Tax=Phytophthora boehmeriae TaxID=109152 RepID=A0A8T1WVC5_9STRA|nr:hypothetical protein PHYBOEH_003204 [Phytophthora boehmeriae]
MSATFHEDTHALDEALSLFTDLGNDFLSPTYPFDQSVASLSTEKVAVKTEPSSSSECNAVPVKEEANPAKTTQTAAAKPKKKRIRRQKLELNYLRELVVKLEDQMTELKTKQNEPQDDKQKAVEAAPSIWKGIAERQLKERERAETKNQKLRMSLEGQLKLATKLEKILRKRPRNEETEVLTDIKRFKPLMDTAVAPTDDEIFADQLAHVQRAHLAVDQLFSGPEYADRSAMFCDIHVMNDPNSDTGVAFVTKSNCMLPFDVHVTEKAFWRAFVKEGTPNLCYFLDERVSTDTLVARSYGLVFDAGCFRVNVRGKQTFRKFVSDNCVMLMWKAISEPVEINGTKFNGLRINQTVWIVFHGVNLEDTADAVVKNEFDGHTTTPGFTTSTSLQSYSKMTLELQDDIVDQELQVGALTDFVVNSHDTITEVCGKMINDVILEEDWNLNGWLDNIAL